MSSDGYASSNSLLKSLHGDRVERQKNRRWEALGWFCCVLCYLALFIEFSWYFIWLGPEIGIRLEIFGKGVFVQRSHGMIVIVDQDGSRLFKMGVV